MGTDMRICGYWVHRAMWTAPCGHGYLDIGYPWLCGQPDVDTDIRILSLSARWTPSVGTDIRILGTQGYVDSPLRSRISGYWSLRAMWTTLCGHGYPDIGHSGLCGQPPAESDIRILVPLISPGRRAAPVTYSGALLLICVYSGQNLNNKEGFEQLNQYPSNFTTREFNLSKLILNK